jgi:hypothetical protein
MSEDLPNCELNRVTNPGKEHFGFPYCHQGDIADPEFGWGYNCKDFTPPIAKLGPHMAPLGMRFYTRTSFPEKYHGAIFTARHGPDDWNGNRKSEIMRELMNEAEGKRGALTGVADCDRNGRQTEKREPASLDTLLHSIIPRWTLHDLRRTGATMMNEFGLAEPHIIEAVLNHVSGASKGGVAGIDNRARYDAQKRAALEHWAAFLITAIDEYPLFGVRHAGRQMGQ